MINGSKGSAGTLRPWQLLWSYEVDPTSCHRCSSLLLQLLMFIYFWFWQWSGNRRYNNLSELPPWSYVNRYFTMSQNWLYSSIHSHTMIWNSSLFQTHLTRSINPIKRFVLYHSCHVMVCIGLRCGGSESVTIRPKPKILKPQPQNPNCKLIIQNSKNEFVLDESSDSRWIILWLAYWIWDKFVCWKWHRHLRYTLVTTVAGCAICVKNLMNQQSAPIIHICKMW